MGQVLNPLLLGWIETQDLYRATTLCGACKSVCPVGIDHPSMFLYYRSKDVLGDPEFQGQTPAGHGKAVLQEVSPSPSTAPGSGTWE